MRRNASRGSGWLGGLGGLGELGELGEFRELGELGGLRRPGDLWELCPPSASSQSNFIGSMLCLFSVSFTEG